MKARPTHPILYEKVKQEAKRKFRVYPSAYANSWLVREYKRRGGTYSNVAQKNSKNSIRPGGLTRWHSEVWIDVCELPRIVPCGRKRASLANYPYCRPRYRINANTPRTAFELSKAEIVSRCRRKKKSPLSRVY